MKKIFNPKSLPYFGALVQAVLFSIAGNEYFPSFGWLVGLGVGAVVNYSLALASSRFSDIAQNRKSLARLSLVAMFCLSPTTITLSLYYPSSLFAAICWAMCVDLSIILAGAIVGKSLTAEIQPRVAAKKKSKLAKAELEPVKSALYCAVAGCERNQANPKAKPFGSQSALNAHQRKHKQVSQAEVLFNVPVNTTPAPK